jgi:ribosomal protein S18 acetylase RimI-like enzyme
VRVCPARRGDFDALLAIEADAFRTDRLTRRKLVHLTTRGNAALLVGVEGRELAGYALVLFRRGTRAARLYGLAVSSTRRGRGLGRRLLAAAEREARRRGCAWMTLETKPGNRSAVTLSKSCGYALAARLGPYYEDGSPAERWSKRLDVS